MKTRAIGFGLLSFSMLAAFQASAERLYDKNLPYPTGTLTADQLAEQLYFVNQFHAFKRYSIRQERRTITVLVNRSEGKKPTTITVERFKNNDYDDGKVRSKEIAIFRSGKLRGTGMLITDFEDDSKSQSYAIWLPALRKVRRFAQPAQDDAWGGTDFTFGDVILRKPKDETHELLGTETFNDCLRIMDIPDNQRNKYMKVIPEADCSVKGKEVYKLKSTTKQKNWWYDHRISYVDTKTFADYRTDFFKDGKPIKFIDRSWVKLADDDPRQLSWGYWYGKNLETGHETLAVIPLSVVTYDKTDKSAKFWSEKQLRKIKR